MTKNRAKKIRKLVAFYRKTLATLKRKYRRSIQRLLTEIPGQKCNEESYRKFGREAVLAQLVGRVYSKGGFTDLPAGTWVLLDPWEEIPSSVGDYSLVTIWSGDRRDPHHTLTPEWLVRGVY